MRRPLTSAIISELVLRLCALPELRFSLFDELEPAAILRNRMKTWLTQAARCDDDAARIVTKIESGGLRPSRQDILRAGAALDREPRAELGIQERQGRIVCTACGNTKSLQRWRLFWDEVVDGAAPIERSRWVTEEEFEELCRQGARLYSYSVPCACTKKATQLSGVAR